MSKLLISLLSLCIIALPAAAQNVMELYSAGKIAEAREIYDKQLAMAERGRDEKALWEALIGSAWFEDVTGNFRRSIELSNRALEIATRRDDRFMLARTLSWLGWAYSSIGLYELSTHLYREARDLSLSEDGEIEIAASWGLSSQELGYLAFKMGDPVSARVILGETLDYARKREVTIGVSEGAAHLAEIELYEGNLADAERLANEAVRASYDCNCNHDNTARALLIRARVAAAQAGESQEQRALAKKLAARSLAFAEKVSSVPNAAFSKLVLSRMLPPADLESRAKLLDSAVQKLSDSESELRGLAAAERGLLYVSQNEARLAASYLETGAQVNREMFRKIDDAHILSYEAVLKSSTGDERSAVEKLKAAVDSALAARSPVQIAAAYEQLAAKYDSLGFHMLALRTTQLALRAVEDLTGRGGSPEAKASILRRKLALEDKLLEIEMRLGGRADHFAPN